MSDAEDETSTRPQGEISVISVPLAGKKLSKRVLKVVKKASSSKILKRGVKEVCKALRKADGIYKGCAALLPSCARASRTVPHPSPCPGSASSPAIFRR